MSFESIQSLPMEVHHRIVEFCSFDDWSQAMRSCCRGLAWDPFHYAQACPCAAVLIAGPFGACDLQKLVDDAVVACDGSSTPVLFLMPGVYEGSLLVSRPIVLIGWASLGNVLLSRRKPTYPSDFLRFGSGCGDASVRNVYVSDSYGWTVAVHAGMPSIVGCTITGGGVILRGGLATLARCTIERSNGHGVDVEISGSSGNVCPLILDCSIRRSRFNGISLDTPAVVEGCTVVQSGKFGVYIAEGVDLSESLLRRTNSVSDSAQRDSCGCDVYSE